MLNSAIRVCIDYHDAASTRETWPCVYRDREQALKFIAAMTELHSGVIEAIWCEVWCSDCDEWELEDEGVCVQCGFQCCRIVLADWDGDLLCKTCTEDRDEDATAFDNPHWRGVSLHGPL